MAVHQQLMKGVKDELPAKLETKEWSWENMPIMEKGGLFLEVKHEPPFHQSRQIIKALKN